MSTKASNTAIPVEVVRTAVSADEFARKVEVINVSKSRSDDDKFCNIELADLTMENKSLGRREFNHSYLRNITFNSMKISYSEFKYAVLENVVFNSCNLENAFFDFAQMNNVIFKDCIMSNAEFDFASGNAEFINCVLENSEFHHTALNMKMVQCSGENIEISYSPNVSVNAENCDFHNGEFDDCTFHGVMKNCVFSHAEFHGSNCKDLKFEDCIRRNTFAKNAEGFIIENSADDIDDDLDFDL